MTIYLCNDHTVSDVIDNWGGCEPHIIKASKAKAGPTCDACHVRSIRTERMVFVQPNV
jgi:hypothetical protein